MSDWEAWCAACKRWVDVPHFRHPDRVNVELLNRQHLLTYNSEGTSTDHESSN